MTFERDSKWKVIVFITVDHIHYDETIFLLRAMNKNYYNVTWKYDA